MASTVIQVVGVMLSDSTLRRPNCGVPALLPAQSFEDAVTDLVRALDQNNNAVHIVLTGGLEHIRFATGISPAGDSIILDRFHSVPLAKIERVVCHGVTLTRAQYSGNKNPLEGARMPSSRTP
jgi:hypothetical protein